ncbi:hypothetical protein ACH5Y9_05385 [Methylomonas sp. BW4-1]|uniref:hypothetical protein n=1 Tax=Methylomonas sp. BW4-1 TaxID=3376685 RepID=UPI004041E1B8
MDFPDVDQSLLATLPPVLQAVVKALGASKARQWVAEFGGSWVYIPERDDPKAGLRVSLCEDDALRLIDALESLCSDNRYVQLPSAKKLNHLLIGNSAISNDDTVNADFPDVAPELLSTLPPVLRAVVLALGFIRAQEWLRDYGGVNIHLPRHKSSALGLSEDEFMRLRHKLKAHMDENGRVTCPKADKLLRVHRNHAITANMHKESIAQQARMYNLCSKQIQNIRRDADDWNMSIFDL